MTIAFIQSGTIGVKTYQVDGPFSLPNVVPPIKYGEVAAGDAESEFVYVAFAPASVPLTLQQGQLVAWDNNYNAALLSTAVSPRGQSVGTIYLGGRSGDAAAAPFATTLTVAGTYGVWVQRSGISLCAAATSAGAGNLANTTTVAGQADAPANPTAGTKLITGLYFPYGSVVFTATTTTGSPVLTLVSSITGLYPGQSVAGTGIPGGTVISLVQGVTGSTTITLSNNATASGSGVAMTANGYLEAYVKWPYVDKTN